MQMVVKVWLLQSYFAKTKMLRVNYLKKKVIGTNVGVGESVIVHQSMYPHHNVSWSAHLGHYNVPGYTKALGIVMPIP
jgi:hypothetical protein